MKFSILVPSVPARREMALALYDLIAAQAVALPVEILLLLDNKQRSIGKKREALVKLAQGDYVAFVDDDDCVSRDYISAILDGIEQAPDVVTFDSGCQINGGQPVRVLHGLEFDNEQYNPQGFRRKPWHIHAWRRELVLPYSFPDVSYGEDWGWCSQFVDKARTEVHVGIEPLYLYRYNSAVSEAA